jgi:NADPH:quinone reductase-like Zn-dependent oxidoreductase
MECEVDRFFPAAGLVAKSFNHRCGCGVTHFAPFGEANRGKGKSSAISQSIRSAAEPGGGRWVEASASRSSRLRQSFLMKAIRIHSFGGPEVLQLDEIPAPVAGEGELLIEVHAASINPVDTKIRGGKFPRFQPALPAILGRDIAGSIERVGKRIKGWEEGEPVYGLLDYERGAYAHYVIATPREITRKPSLLDPVRAAAVPLAGLTAWQALFDQGELQSGQRVLIHGAAGGVGHFAVQFAVARGAHVSVTASAKDHDWLKKLGAEQTIDYKTQRFEEEVSAVDLVIDLVAGETRERSWKVLKPSGKLVSTLGRPKPPSDAPAGAEGREVVLETKMDQLAEIGHLFETGKVSVLVNKVFPLAEAAQAHLHLENGHAAGKTVLSMT